MRYARFPRLTPVETGQDESSRNFSGMVSILSKAPALQSRPKHNGSWLSSSYQILVSYQSESRKISEFYLTDTW